MSPSEKSNIFRNLAKYVQSGMGIEKACDSLLGQPGIKKEERKIYDSIQRGVTSGKSIAESMAESSPLDVLDFEMLNASERGGKLDSGLNHLSTYYQRLDRTQRKIRKGLTYPVLLFHFALIVTTFTGAMITRINPVSEGTPFLEALWQAGRWALVIYFALVVLGIILILLRKQARHSPGPDRILNQVPVLGKARKYAALDRFTSVFEIFLLAGLKMDESMKGAGEASNSGTIRKVAMKEAKAIRNGETLATAFLSNPAAFPNDFARGVAAAEESGMLDIEFARWKQFYAESLSDAMDQLAEWVPKLVYFTTLFVVAAMIIKVGLAYRSLIQGFLDHF